MKKFICLILAILMLTFLLSACKNSSPVSSKVDDDGRFAYTIVRKGDDTAPVVQDAAKELRNTMKDNFGCKVTLVKDDTFEDFAGNLEILVGETNRKESNEALKRLINNRPNHADDFIVAVIGDKIVINAVNNQMIPVAVEWFISKFCQNFDTWAMLKSNYQFIYAPVKSNTSVNVANENLGGFTVVLPRACSYVAAMGIEDYTKHYSNLGYSTQILYDFEAETTYELLIGNCNRAASQSIKVEGDNYVIKVVGTKLVVKGGTDLATNAGVKELLKEITAEKEINWTDGFTINGKYDATEKGVYTLNWHDEFESNTIDYNKWGDYRNQAFSDTTASCLGGTMYWSNVFGESKCPHEFKSIYQADGKMIIPSQRVSDKDFIGGSVSTYWTMTYKYGILEIRGKLAQLPATVSYWVNGASVNDEKFAKRFGTNQTRVCQVEIDLLENYGRLNTFSSNIHRWWTEYDANGIRKASAHKSLNGMAAYSGSSPNNMWYIHDPERFGSNLHEDFHNYTFYWDDKCMKFAFDGQVYLNYEYKDNSSSSAHCLMDYFITGSRIGSATYGETFDKEIHGDYYEHQMDYIRIYQTDAINSQMITAWPQKQENGTSTVLYPENTVGVKY